MRNTNWFKHRFYENGRRGPFELVVNFTTTTIVKRRIIAKRNRILVFIGRYIIVIWDINDEKMEGVIIKVDDIIDRVIRDIDIIIKLYRKGIVWFGIIDTKYENITNIPPM